MFYISLITSHYRIYETIITYFNIQFLHFSLYIPITGYLWHPTVCGYDISRALFIQGKPAHTEFPMARHQEAYIWGENILCACPCRWGKAENKCDPSLQNQPVVMQLHVSLFKISPRCKCNKFFITFQNMEFLLFVFCIETFHAKPALNKQTNLCVWKKLA